VERGKAEEGSAMDVKGKAASVVARVAVARAPKLLPQRAPNPPLVV